MNLRRWLTPGIGVKRWILVAFLGLLVLAVGLAHVLRQVTAQADPGGPVNALIDLLTLQFLPYQLRGLLARVGHGDTPAALMQVARTGKAGAPQACVVLCD